MLYLTQNTRNGRKQTGIWYIRGTVNVWRDGRFVKIPAKEQSTRTTSKKEAQGILEQRQEAIKGQNINNQTDAPPFAEWVANYMEASGQNRFMERILDFYEGLPADMINDEKIIADGPKAYPGCKPATIRRQWDTPLRAIINHNTNPKRRKVEDNARTYFFTPEQADSLIEAFAVEKNKAGPWARPLLTFLFGQGCRMGETLALDAKQDVFLDHGFVILRDTKNNSERRVTLIPRVRAALSTLPNIGKAGPLFKRWDGEPFAERENTGGQIKSRFARAVKDIGLDPSVYTPHVCRHSWGTWFYSQTLDVVRLKSEGGWKSDTWERYVKLASPELGQDAKGRNWDFDGTWQNVAASRMVK